MATIQNSPNSPKFTPAPKPAKNRTPLLAGVIVVLLLALAGLAYGYTNRGTENAELTSDKMELEKLKAQTEKQYYESLAELEEMRGSNEELNALIDQQKDELRTQRDKITALSRDSRNLAAARRELDELKSQTESYLIEIEDLRLANAQLTDDNQTLTTERDLLSSDLQVSRQQNENLNSERAVLVSEREQLTSQNQELSRKVNIASVLKTNNITMVGQKARNNGKWVDRGRAKSVERLLVCFNSMDNNVADSGEETFQLRIINPNGETIQIDAEGSGIMTSAESGEQIPYTKSVSFDFDGTASNHCAEWNVASTQYSPGVYNVEVYNKGFLVGTGTAKLK